VSYPAARAVALLTAAALAGCGPFGGDGGAGGAEPASEEELTRSGDEICRAAQEQVAEVQRDPPTNRAESVRFARELIAIFEDEVAQLAALEPPEERRADLDRYLDAREEAIGLLAEGRAAAKQNDAEGYANAQAEVAAGQVERAQLARQVGFSECSATPLATQPQGNAP
jgi:hypothetical protein